MSDKKAYNKEYYKKNRERIIAKRKIANQNDPLFKEKRKKYSQKYYLLHKEKILEKQKPQSAKYREKVRNDPILSKKRDEYHKQWRKNNPEKMAQYAINQQIKKAKKEFVSKKKSD